MISERNQERVVFCDCDVAILILVDAENPLPVARAKMGVSHEIGYVIDSQ